MSETDFKFPISEAFLMDDIKNYRYLSNGAMPVPGTDDKEMYRQLLEAMDIMGISQDEQDSIHRTISAVLLFGNMMFKQERNSDQATLPDNTSTLNLISIRFKGYGSRL